MSELKRGWINCEERSEEVTKEEKRSLGIRTSRGIVLSIRRTGVKYVSVGTTRVTKFMVDIQILDVYNSYRVW